MSNRARNCNDTGSAEVHLHLRGPFDEQSLAILRRLLALLMAAGVLTIQVDVDEGLELGLPTLQVVQGADKHLTERGGYLRLVAVPPAAGRLQAASGVNA